ncbi:MAG: SUMF1/EgtB/PvdO family nonheme iron enzyme [Candidatus Competibacteraceae bacterium]
MKDSDKKPSVEELTRQIARLQAELQAFQDQASKGRRGRRRSQGLQAEVQTLQGQTKATAHIKGGVKVNKGDAVVGTKIDTINIRRGIYEGEAPRSPAEARSIYLSVIADRCGDIPLTGLDREADDAGSRYRPLGLERVYIDLDTEIKVSTKAVEKALAARQQVQAMPLFREDQADDMRPLSALEAAALQRRLVLTGAPGSGKTTFVNRLCLALARAEWKDLERWPKRERRRLPVLVILRDFAQWIASRPTPPEPCAALLWEFIEHDLKRRKLDFAGEWVQQALEQGQAQVFLDGLDEVPPALRSTVLPTIVEFARRYENAWLLITCRVASYQQVEWRLPEERFPKFELAPFDSNKIQHFVTAWYDEMAERWKEPRERTRELAAKLNEALHRSDLARLAPNPLLLTVMALVHTHDKVLPDHRAVLYERIVELLLWRWEGRKQDRGEEPELLARLRQAGCSPVDLLRELRRIAFEAHAQVKDSDNPEQVAGIADAVLWKELSRLHPDKEQNLNWARGLVEHIRQRAGLLVEREPGVFTFPHRTFQEYLAGVHLAVELDFIAEAMKLAERGAFWREVILLAVGYLVHSVGKHAQPLVLLDRLCPAKQPVNAAGWRKVELAGEVLLEIGPNRVERQEQGESLLERVRKRLTALMERGLLDPAERAQAGEVLGTLGDPRFDARRLYLPYRYRDKEEANWGFVEIPAGPFWMGSEQGDSEANDDEFGNHKPLEITYPYWIARYPITVAQFGCFVEDGGYTQERWWRTRAAKEWLRENQPTAPREWDSQRFHPTRPVVNITWFEAMAYCAWLDAQLRQLNNAFVPEGYEVRLPTEAEWEKAARGGERLRYPWGSENWDKQRANIDKSGFGHPTPVGMYPKGATKSGLHDMSGNVLEWTLSQGGNYPYDLKRNQRLGLEWRVLRGGSWFFHSRWVRCASRPELPADAWGPNRGVRVVVSLANSEC